MIHTIAHQLVMLLRQKRFLEAQETLFATEAISLEPEFNKEKSVYGLKAMMTKEKTFLDHIQHWNHYEVSEPLISKNHFSIHMITKVTLKNDQDVSIDEIIVYEVGNNKIIKEEFFYK